MSMLSTNHVLKVTTTHEQYTGKAEVFEYDSYGKALAASQEFTQMYDVYKVEYYLDDELHNAWYC